MIVLPERLKRRLSRSRRIAQQFDRAGDAAMASEANEEAG
jgi:hypothetical protein